MADDESQNEHSRGHPPAPDLKVVDLPEAVSTAAEPGLKRPVEIRGRIALLIGLLAASAVVYVGLLTLLYRDKPVVELMFGVPVPQAALDLTVNLISVDPVREVINIRIEAARASESRWWQSLDAADLGDFVVHVDDRYLTFQVASSGGQAKAVLEIALNGSINEYPFDRYTGRLSIRAAKKGNDVALPVRLTVWPLLANWSVEVKHETTERTGWINLNAELTRPLSFVVMALAFYTAMALIGLSGLAIGTLVFLGVRPVEAALTGALGAMIFSIPALRGIMPGAPPLGIHADALILVWVQLAVIIGLTLFVSTWVWRIRRGD